MLPGSASVVAAADLVPERLNEFCRTFHVSRGYQDAAALIADRDVNLVAITTPPSAHEALIIASLENRKYVFCEKPLAHSLASAVRIAEAEARHPGRLAVSYQMRYDAPFRRLTWLCRNGAIGDIQSGYIERHSSIPNGDHANGRWWGSWGTSGGGVLMTQLIHELDLLLLLMGRPLSVSAEMDTRYSKIESEDCVQANFRFSGGRTAYCAASVNSGHLGGRFVIGGSDGSISLPWNVTMRDERRRAQALRDVDKALPDTRPRSSVVSSGLRLLQQRFGVQEPADLTPHARLYLEIAQNIKRGEPLPIPSAEAFGSLELCMAAYESAISGREVALPLSSASAIYDGVRKERYDGRESSRNTTHAGFRASARESRPYQVPATSNGTSSVGMVRRALGFANIEPAAIKALFRKPSPVHGGPRVRRWPWPRRRHFDRRERQAVIDVIDREIYRGGAIVYGGVEENAYCEAFANYMGGGFADAVNSGTNAVYIAIRALDLEPGSEIIVPPTTDAGGTMPVVMNLCIPVPADSAPGSVHTSVDQIRAVMTEPTSAIIVAHIAGHPVDMDPILKLAAERRIPVVEDCAQAHGALYKGQMVGSLGAIAAFSTMFAKHHATGAQGGVVFTKDPRLFAKVKRIADRGKSHDERGNQANVLASLNFNQDEISMAIGRVQLEKLPGAIMARRRFVSLVETGLSNVEGVSFVGDPPGCSSSYLFMMLRLEFSRLCCDSHEFASALREEGIDGVDAGYSIYPTDQPWHKEGLVFGTSRLPWALGEDAVPRHYELPNARQANRGLVRVDIHESLGPREARELVAAIEKIAAYYRAPA